MFEQANYLIENHLEDNWTKTDIDFDNVEFNPVRGNPFIRLQVEWVDSNIVSIPGRVRGTGYVDISIFIPYGVSTVEAFRSADELADLFNKWTSGALRFTVASVMRVGQQEEWFQVKVIVPFEYDQCFVV